jgi:hypothetical protein
MQKITSAIPDVLIVAGSLALSYGAGLLHLAAGFVTAGLLMIAGGVIAETKRAAANKKVGD